MGVDSKRGWYFVVLRDERESREEYKENDVNVKKVVFHENCRI